VLSIEPIYLLVENDNPQHASCSLMANHAASTGGFVFAGAAGKVK